jgi:mannose/fructose/N-acetylgalactosamine-specific phosphotransferase system component IIC
LDPIGQLANVFIGGFVISLSLLVGLLGFAIPAAVGIALLYFVVKKLFFSKKKEDKK